MAPQDKKWDDAAQRDLCVAMIMGNQDGERMRYNWNNIHQIMSDLGYTFTKDAMAQHFSKVIMKEFKTRHAVGGSSGDANIVTPRKRASGPRKKAAAGKRVSESDDDDHKDDSVQASAKKIKTEKMQPVKKDPDEGGFDNGFGAWMEKYSKQAMNED